MKASFFSLLIPVLFTWIFSSCGTSTTPSETDPVHGRTKALFEAVQSGTDPEDIFQLALEADTINFKLPAIQSPSVAMYNGYWVLIGGRKAGLHSLDNDPPSFQKQAANDSIWVVDIQNGSAIGVPIPSSYFIYLSGSSQQYYQENDSFYISGGYTISDSSQERSNWTSDHFFEINLPNLIQYVQSGGNSPGLDQVFTKVIQSPFLQVTGGEMIVVNSNFYLVGGQNYVGAYDFGNTGVYTNAIKKFEIADASNNWTLTDTLSLIDPINLHRRDFNLAEIIREGADSVGAAIYGGVFTSDDMGYQSPVYISGLASGSPSISVDTTLLQEVNLYSSAKINGHVSGGIFSINHLSFLGGITLMEYDTLQKKLVLPKVGNELPFSNLISSYLTDGTTSSYEMVQIPPYPLMPGYLGANAIFFPLQGLTKDGFPNILSFNKVFEGYANEPVLVGYMYGGIQSPAPNTITPSQNYSTYVNPTMYKVYMSLAVKAN